MTDTTTIQGRQIGPAELACVRALLAEHPDWSRWRLSRHLAEAWNWRNPAGQLKDMAARTFLLKLARRDWISLPARRCVPPNRMRPKQAAPPVLAEPAACLTHCSLGIIT